MRSLEPCGSAARKDSIRRLIIFESFLVILDELIKLLSLPERKPSYASNEVTINWNRVCARHVRITRSIIVIWEGKKRKNDLKMHFFAKIFGHVKKKQYFCTLFRRKSIGDASIAQLVEH